MPTPTPPGLHRANLATLCSRGPWVTMDGEIDGEGVRRTYEAILRGYDERGSILLPWQGSDRRTDRALTLLRKAGLIVCDGKPRRWRPTFLTPTPPTPGEE